MCLPPGGSRVLPIFRGLIRVAIALLLGLLGSATSVAAEYFRVTETPDWVEPLPVPSADSAPAGQTQDGIYILLSDTQINALQSPRETYYHSAIKLLNDTGVQNGSQISIEFDPSYLTLELHHIGIRRDGKFLDRLQPDRIRVLQREKLLEFQLYDGRRTALLFLGLRVREWVNCA
jgi:hypothetical protein